MATQRCFRQAAAGAVLAALASVAANASESVDLTLANGIAPTVPTSWMFTDFLQPRLESYSDGRIKVTTRVGGTLCVEHTCVEQAQLGQIDIGSVSGGNIGAFGSTFDILNLPYIFKDSESAAKVLNGWLFEELRARAREEMDLHVISIVPSLGFRNVQNRLREVRVPSDLRGIKVRVTKTAVELLLLRGWGAVAMPFDWGQLYEGLQTGVVDGMYIPDAYVAAQSFYEVAPYITATGGGWNTHIIFMRADRYDALPDWARAAIDRAGNELQAEAFAIDHEWESRLLTELEGKVQYYIPTDEEMSLWLAEVPPVWAALRDSFDPVLARRVLEDQGMDELIAGLEEIGIF